MQVYVLFELESLTAYYDDLTGEHWKLLPYSLQFIYSESRKSLVQLCSIRISIGLVNTI